VCLGAGEVLGENVGGSLTDPRGRSAGSRAVEAEAGRNPDEVPMSIFVRQDTEVLKRYRDAGVEPAVIMVGSKGRDGDAEGFGCRDGRGSGVM
jgi:hypothetical protein